MLTPLVPGKPTAKFLGKFLLDANGEAVRRILFAGSLLKVESLVLCQGKIPVETCSIQFVPLDPPCLAGGTEWVDFCQKEVIIVNPNEGQGGVQLEDKSISSISSDGFGGFQSEMSPVKSGCHVLCPQR